jgi:hypothetical protein
MRLDDELTELRARVDELAHGPATIHDWCRADLRARKAILSACVCHAGELIDELMLLRMCIESRIEDLEAGRA